MIQSRERASRPEAGGPDGGLRVAVLGNYIPRRCGIATFTSGLCEALAGEAPDSRVQVLAMNDQPEGYDYPPRVVFEVDADRIDDYHLAANFIHAGGFDVLCVQHEYGIFGGRDGSHLLTLLRQLRVPFVATLHTVLRKPTANQRRVLADMADLAEQLVVMNPRSARVLTDVYGADPDRVAMIHHGIPDVPFTEPGPYQEALGLEGRKVILTFGLLSPGKGLEHMIEAMPGVAEKHPEALYVILGRTHPHIVRESGESYRTKLHRLARDLGVEDNVLFQNEFVGLSKLFDYLRAADAYVTPYPNLEQAVSGTLAYAMGTGRAIVSTRYAYAEVMLDAGRGLLVPPRDPAALAAGVNALLADDAERNAIRRRAYDFTRGMTWSRVAEAYLGLFGEAVEASRARPEPVVAATSPEGSWLGLQEAPSSCPLPPALPPVNFDHLRIMTDDTGMFQHARFTVPCRSHGYSTDDNARALLAVVLAKYVTPDDPTLKALATRYLSFLDDAFVEEAGRFRNFMTYDRRWLEPQGSEDSHGRSLWALGTAVALDQNEGHRMLAADLFRRAMEAVPRFHSPRSHAFAILGMHAYLEWFENDETMQGLMAGSATRLLERFQAEASGDWPWCEGGLTYANAKLPHALLVAGRALHRDEMVEQGLRSLAWLAGELTDEDDCFSPVGNHGWYYRGKEKARYDQQPLEAHAMLEACLAAYDATREERWLGEAQRAFEWFLGRNDMLWPVYDATTGGCRDGLMEGGLNENQGAESTLAWLLALLEMHLHRSARRAEAAARADAAESEAEETA